MGILAKMWYYMDQYWDDIGDPRVNDWFLIKGGIWKILSIMSIYLVITRILLPRYMMNRKPFVLRNAILVYNISMMLANAYGFYWAVIAVEKGSIFLDFRYPSREDRSQKTMWYFHLGYMFFISRIYDLMDTLFFVLRKKESQITSLHLYHHTVVPILAWVSFKYNGMIPIIRMFVLFNTAIHVFMYAYYALAAFGPKLQPYLWWKVYITQFQILQFVICGSYGVIVYFLQTDYPMEWFWFAVGQNPLFFYMFYDFYKKSYKCKAKRQINGRHELNGNAKKAN